MGKEGGAESCRRIFGRRRPREFSCGNRRVKSRIESSERVLRKSDRQVRGKIGQQEFGSGGQRGSFRGREIAVSEERESGRGEEIGRRREEGGCTGDL